METNELQSRTERLNENSSADAVKLLQLCSKLSSEGKVKNSAMQNEIPQLLQNVEESQALLKKITAEEKISNLCNLINTVSAKKISASNKIFENRQQKNYIDKKIDSLVTSINKILREDSALESDFTFSNTSDDGIRITSYIGPNFEMIKIPATIQGRKVKSIYGYAFKDVAASKFVIPESVSEIDSNAFNNPTRPLKILFSSENPSWIFTRAIYQIIKRFFLSRKNLNSNYKIDRNCFSTAATLYCENIVTENNLRKIFSGRSSQIKFSDNIGKFFEDSTAIFSYQVKKIIAYLFLILFVLATGIMILPYAAMLFLVMLIVGGLAVIAGASENHPGVCLIYVIAAVALLYVKGGDFFDYMLDYRNSAVDLVYEKFHSNEDRYAFKVGNVAVRLNNSGGVEKTVVNYNSAIQVLYENALQKNHSSDAAAYKSILVKSIVVSENLNYIATLNNDDCIYFKTDAEGYILSAEILIREDHTSISKPVLNNLIKYVANVEIKNFVLQKVLDEIISGEKNSAFYSLAANRNFKISQSKDKNFFKFTVQAFMK